MYKKFAGWLLCLTASLAWHAHGASLLDEARVVEKDAAAAALLPDSLPLVINAAGTYTLTLTDVSAQTGLGDPFASLAAAVTQGYRKIAALNQPGSTTMTLSPGEYQVQVLGVTSTASQYAVRIATESEEALNYSGAINVPSDTDASILQQELTLSAGSSYTITVSDLAFPGALQSIEWSIAQGANPVVCHTTGSGSCTFTASADGNILFVVATADTSLEAGMYAVEVVNSAAQRVYASTQKLGSLPEPVAITLPASASYSLTSFDPAFPDPLTEFELLLVQDSTVRLQQSTPGTGNFNGVAGQAHIYVYARTSADSASTYSILIKRGATTDYSNAFVVLPEEEPDVQTGYSFNMDIPVAGVYVLRLEDFTFPQAFAGLSAAISQEGLLLDVLESEGSLSITAQSGVLNVAVLATPGSTEKGLFGVSLTADGSSSPLFEATQGVGASFRTFALQPAANGSHRVNVSDFGTPEPLADLAVALVRGSEVIGYIYGGGYFDFDATAGDYSLNVLATTAATSSFGMYGVNVSTAPTLTFSAASTSLTSGGSTTVTWTASDADTCTASGGWTGGRATSGSEAIGPVTANLVLSLSCTGVGGTTTKSVNLAVASESSTRRGGGGAIGVWAIAVFGLLAMLRVRAARRGDSKAG